MRSFRTSVFVAAAVATLSFAGVSRAQDDVSNKKGTTTKSHSTSTTKSGSGQSGSTQSGSSQSGSGSTGSGSTGGTSSGTGSSGSDITTDTPGPTPSTTPPTGMGPDPSVPTGTDSTTGTGYGSTYSVTPGVTDTTSTQYSPYQQQPTSTTTYSTTATTSADYDERAGAESAGYKYRPNRPLLATGLGIFGATYGASVIVGAASDLNEDKRLFIPVVGPWLDMGERPCGLGDCSTREDVHNVLLIGSGVAQGVGIGLTIASLFVPEEREVKRNASAAEKSTAAMKPKVHVLPVSVRGGGGLGAVGTF